MVVATPDPAPARGSAARQTWRVRWAHLLRGSQPRRAGQAACSLAVCPGTHPAHHILNDERPTQHQRKPAHGCYLAMSEESIAAQKAIEAADTLPFEAWREQYMAVEGLG